MISFYIDCRNSMNFDINLSICLFGSFRNHSSFVAMAQHCRQIETAFIIIIDDDNTTTYRIIMKIQILQTHCILSQNGSQYHFYVKTSNLQHLADNVCIWGITAYTTLLCDARLIKTVISRQTEIQPSFIIYYHSCLLRK